MESMSETRVRRTAFTALIALVSGGTLINHFQERIDPCLWSYSIVTFLSGWTVAVSIWWWWQVDTTSTVFRWLVLLVFGVGISDGLQMYVRSLLVSGKTEAYHAVIHTWWWHYREIVTVVALVYLVSLILGRLSTEDGKYGRGHYDR